MAKSSSDMASKNGRACADIPIQRSPFNAASWTFKLPSVRHEYQSNFGLMLMESKFPDELRSPLFRPTGNRLLPIFTKHGKMEFPTCAISPESHLLIRMCQQGQQDVRKVWRTGGEHASKR